jgi:hypothetical protein
MFYVKLKSNFIQIFSETSLSKILYVVRNLHISKIDNLCFKNISIL